jgi:hypothetical protein
MAIEKDEKVFEEAAAERELDELRLAIEESRRRRRRADEAFDTFLKSFAEPPRRAATPEPQPAAVKAVALPAPPPAPVQVVAPPVPQPAPVQVVAPSAPPTPSEPPAQLTPEEINRVSEDDALDEGLMAFAPATAASPGKPARRSDSVDLSSLDNFADEAAPLPASALLPPAATPMPPIPTALSGSARPGATRAAFLAVAAVVAIVLAAVLIARGRSTQVPPQEAAEATPPPAAAAAPPAVSPAVTEPPPSVEILTVRRVWLRVIADGAKVIEREVPADTRIPVPATSQVSIRAGDAGAVRVSVAGKDQGVLGVTGQPATKTFAVK